MRIAICDDEIRFAEELQTILCAKEAACGLKLDIHIFTAAEDFLYEIEEMPPYDSVFLDIELGSENGIRIAEQLREKYPATLIAFITGYRQYIDDVFSVQPCGFIPKPIQPKRAVQVLETMIRLAGIMPVFEFSQNRNRYRILLKDVFYFMSDKRQIVIAGQAGEQRFYSKLDEVEAQVGKLSGSFVRISKSVMINLQYLVNLDQEKAVLANGTKWMEFRISPRYRQGVQSKFKAMWK